MEPVPGNEASVEAPQQHDSQTAADFIDQQLSLEQDAREVLPYKFDKCTSHLGPLRQEVYACLTCSSPPASAAQVYTPAGVCYACSISCHGEHNLVELFNRRNFVCDCGTTRMPDTSLCTLRTDLETGRRGTHSQEAAKGNKYNHNFQNKFCTCGDEYDADSEKGTMFQCIGLGTVETGGCGEDWYHPECLMGLPRDWYKTGDSKKENHTITEPTSPKSDTHPAPPGFPNEDDFDTLVCYKCVSSNPWIKRYANTPGFLAPVFKQDATLLIADVQSQGKPSLKRKTSSSDSAVAATPLPSKRVRETTPPSLPAGLAPATDPTITTPPKPISAHATVTSEQPLPTLTSPKHLHSSLPPAPPGTFSLFLTSTFRDHLCHCPKCYPNLLPHPQLLEEEDTYEPSISNSDASQPAPGSGTRSHGTGSLLDRGEAALNNIDRVKAIEGVMVYNHLRDKVKAFLKPYAESGKVVEAEDIKAYFEKLRGDDQAIREAGRKPEVDGEDGNDNGNGDNRREQSGY